MQTKRSNTNKNSSQIFRSETKKKHEERIRQTYSILAPARDSFNLVVGWMSAADEEPVRTIQN